MWKNGEFGLYQKPLNISLIIARIYDGVLTVIFILLYWIFTSGIPCGEKAL